MIANQKQSSVWSEFQFNARDAGVANASSDRGFYFNIGDSPESDDTNMRLLHYLYKTPSGKRAPDNMDAERVRQFKVFWEREALTEAGQSLHITDKENFVNWLERHASSRGLSAPPAKRLLQYLQQQQ